MSDRSSQFFPPQLNPLFTRLCQSISYPAACLAYQLELAIAPEDVAKLKEIESERIVYLPNHPTLDDGVVMFLLSARIGQLFNYIIAQEAFQGWIGKFLQTIGAYSIRRGVGDRSSIVQTLKLLQQPATHLVIFPEGGCSYQNDTVMPFRAGAIELSFKALAQIAKQETVPDFYLVPVSLKYRYTSPMDSAIAKTLSHLEATLKITPLTNDFYQRLRIVAERILIDLEHHYFSGKLDTTLNWNQRIERLKELLIDRCETKLGLTPADRLPLRERVYKIQSLLDSPLQALDITKATREDLYQTTVRLLNFDAIYDGYVAEYPTAERFLDTLARLEREVYQINYPPVKGHRKACINIGSPVNLKDYFTQYRENREAVVQKLNQQLQETVQKNLTQSAFD
ncbi:1-acyl-sn-glycerol-3-phosphate acyltransferase [Myxosarcina sp. GI1]|uniref:1-acyl-sn-glycerol-3-phosphate acyltransferase n=1 Tax=Myxosarcina sp. GI1 TaxID=1541065 RepID=UPI00056A8681|nr:1-acyl-sn-glycerol-3-phosphate acyltransferase [Myxosarcina sp. GI1]